MKRKFLLTISSLVFVCFLLLPNTEANIASVINRENESVIKETNESLECDYLKSFQYFVSQHISSSPVNYFNPEFVTRNVSKEIKPSLVYVWKEFIHSPPGRNFIS